MSIMERVHTLVEELSECDLLVAERILRGLRLPPEPAGGACDHGGGTPFSD